MSGPNHVTGGLVFTGIFCSFWNINIFATPIDVALCIFFSLLPDIDHTKTLLGKTFFPIAKYLDKNYGHRTITHSLLVYFGLFGLCAFIQHIWFPNSNLAIIFAFSYLSHFIFDMMTKQGIPLFYPFKRNPCVIPGNPEYRFRSSDLKTESIIFVVFIFLGFTCQPLFANGFWSTYNNQFNTLQHLHNERKLAENLLSVDYEYVLNGKNIKGNGLLLFSKESEAYLFNTDYVHLNKEVKIISLATHKTNKPIKVEEQFFYNIKFDSLQKLISNKPIINLKLQSTNTFSYTKNNKPSTGKSADLEYVYNPKILFVNDSLTSDIRNKIEIFEYELQKELQQLSIFKQERYRLNDSINRLTISINEMDFYEREKATEQLQKLKLKKASLNEPEDNSEKIKLQLKHLYEKLNGEESTTYSGFVSFFRL